MDWGTPAANAASREREGGGGQPEWPTGKDLSEGAVID